MVRTKSPGTFIHIVRAGGAKQSDALAGLEVLHGGVSACLAGSAAGSAEWFRRACSARREDDLGGFGGWGSPPGVDGQGTCAFACSEPEADELVFEQERAPGASLVLRPLAFGEEWTVRDADGGHIQHGAQVEGKAGSAWMVSACGVD